jgi:hypothetical protein
MKKRQKINDFLEAEEESKTNNMESHAAEQMGC